VSLGQPERDLVALFVKALRRLGNAGEPEEASKLAAQAWWALKDTDPRAAEHVNGVMHYLAGLEESSRAEEVQAEANPRQTARPTDTPNPDGL